MNQLAESHYASKKRSIESVLAFKVMLDKISISYIYGKLFAKSFLEHIGVVNFFKENLVLQVGLDSGTIIFYKTSEESKYLSYEELRIIKPHNGRVMGLAFDPKPRLSQNYIWIKIKKF